jgi:hypothetical protein
MILVRILRRQERDEYQYFFRDLRIVKEQKHFFKYKVFIRVCIAGLILTYTKSNLILWKQINCLGNPFETQFQNLILKTILGSKYIRRYVQGILQILPRILCLNIHSI